MASRSHRMPVIGSCPDQCSGGKPDRQMNMTPGILEQIDGDARAELQASGRGKRCTYCGLVYLSASSGAIRLGFYNSGVLGDGWKPLRH